VAASSRTSDSATTTFTRLKAFLLGLDRGFCFEAQSQRLALAEEHILVDLVFYHRVVKCYFLVNVRFASLRPADSATSAKTKRRPTTTRLLACCSACGWSLPR
jgi:hypothetical protein